MAQKPKAKYHLSADEVLYLLQFILGIGASFIDMVRRGERQGWDPSEYHSSVDPEAEVVLSGLNELYQKYFRAKGPVTLKQRNIRLAILAVECQEILTEYVRAENEGDYYYPRAPGGGKNIRDLEDSFSPDGKPSKEFLQTFIDESGSGFEPDAKILLSSEESYNPSMQKIKRLASVLEDISEYNEVLDTDPSNADLRKAVGCALAHLRKGKNSKQEIHYAANIAALQLFQPDKNISGRNLVPSDKTVENARAKYPRKHPLYYNLKEAYGQALHISTPKEFILRELFGISDKCIPQVMKTIEKVMSDE